MIYLEVGGIFPRCLHYKKVQKVVNVGSSACLECRYYGGKGVDESFIVCNIE